MLTLKELDLLLTKPLREAVREHISSDPAKIALDKNIPYAQLVATQVKYLQKARKKLPSYYKAQCIISAKGLKDLIMSKSSLIYHLDILRQLAYLLGAYLPIVLILD